MNKKDLKALCNTLLNSSDAFEKFDGNLLKMQLESLDTLKKNIVEVKNSIETLVNKYN